MSDAPSLDALAAAARGMLNGACTCPTYAAWSPGCARSDCPCHGEHVPRAPDLARGYVAAVDALRSVRSELDVLRANRGTADRLLGAWATIAHAYRVDPSVANAERLAVLTTSAAEVRDAAIARATAAEAQRAALAAAVREERAAAVAETDADDALCRAIDDAVRAKGRQSPRVAASWREKLDAAKAAHAAATARLDALLSGCAADVVRAGVVRDFLAALDAGADVAMRGAGTYRAALDAALAAAEGR